MTKYTGVYKGFQIRDCVYLGGPPKNAPIQFDVVKWVKPAFPYECTNLETGKTIMREKYCYSVANLIYDEKNSCFDLKSIGLRWLEEHPDKDVENWIISWCTYKELELRERENNNGI